VTDDVRWRLHERQITDTKDYEAHVTIHEALQTTGDDADIRYTVSQESKLPSFCHNFLKYWAITIIAIFYGTAFR